MIKELVSLDQYSSMLIIEDLVLPETPKNFGVVLSLQLFGVFSWSFLEQQQVILGSSGFSKL